MRPWPLLLLLLLAIAAQQITSARSAIIIVTRRMMSISMRVLLVPKVITHTLLHTLIVAKQVIARQLPCLY